MSDFDNFFADSTTHLLDSLGQLVLWQHPDGAGAGSAMAIVGPISQEERGDALGRSSRQVRMVTVRTSDIILPTLRLNFTINMNVWQVEAIEQTSGNMTSFRCVKVGRIEQTRADFRKE